jgi:hypothetical protein
LKKTESNGPGALAAGLLNGAVCVPAQMKRTKVLAILGIAAMGAATVANAQCPVETSNLQNIAMLHWSLTTPPANRTPLSLDFKTAFFAGNGTTINVPTPYAISSAGDGTVQVSTPGAQVGGNAPWWTTPLTPTSLTIPSSVNIPFVGTGLGSVITYSLGPGNLLNVKEVPTRFTNPIASFYDDNKHLWSFNAINDNEAQLYDVTTVGAPGPESSTEVFGSSSSGAFNSKDIGDSGLAKVAYDGSNFWVANALIGPGLGQGIFKIPAKNLGTPVLYNLTTAQQFEPTGLFFDGSSLWVATTAGVTSFGDFAGSKTLGVTSYLNKLDLNGNKLLSVEFPSPIGGLAFDGENLWVTVPELAAVEKIWPEDGTVLDVLHSGTVGAATAPLGIGFDGRYMWVANNRDNTISKFCASTDALLETKPGGGDPFAVAFDGTGIWVTNPKSGVLSYRLEN